jgi:hypothetical protein
MTRRPPDDPILGLGIDPWAGLDVAMAAAQCIRPADPMGDSHRRLRCVCPLDEYVAYVSPTLIREHGPPTCPCGQQLKAIIPER